MEWLCVQKTVTVPGCKAFGTLVFVHFLVDTIHFPKLHVIACLCDVYPNMIMPTMRTVPMITPMIIPQLVFNWIICKFSALSLHVNTSDPFLL